MLLEGRYRLGERIARGGMSTVYRGTDLRLDRPVAIKVMDPQLAADPAFRRRFEREARSAARLDHPGVVDVHDQGSHDDGSGQPMLFLVMELVDGGTLRDVLRQRRTLPVAEALAVLEPVLSGLAAAHRLGLVHRDVKPENVLISQSGSVKVADFGLVTAAAEAGVSTAGMIMGTVAYLSPEQVTTGAADPRSDVYAAGILLYEMLTGVPPYQGETALSVAYRHVNDSVPPPSARAPQVPTEIDELVECATHRDPGSRPKDAAALAERLRRARAALGIPRVGVPLPPAPLVEPTTVPVAPRPGGPRGTRVFEPAPAPPGQAPPAWPQGPQGPQGPAGQDPPPAQALPPHLQQRRRSRRLFLGWLAGLLLAGLLIAVLAWWLGSGRWTSMPHVVGLDQVSAQTALADAGLAPKVSPAAHDTVASGVVISADPQENARVVRGSEVSLVVSAGRPRVPKIDPGTARDTADQTVRDASLTPRFDSASDEYSTTVPSGAVVRTDPPANTELRVNAPVTVVLSRGPPPQQIQVPMLIGRTVSQAERDLERLGLKADVQSLFGGSNGRVAAQNPGPGEMVDPGSTVTLTAI
jgi:serine/threonine-protein kinase